ncbi:PLP-dependent aminotransferase family protein [Roseospira visakhapatnamensis]|uniref:DNA-binding transcriptional MocR family regulator n=1 Tax=Roseospira visakhapatnamensis TaxID=390880 RepID=A0A7W6W9P6_9PROT|nr:PLP-dependent aminotransferase family protein [Roseospira visakhapatnamensis]MBB4266013.1 DNA-binding transcriptional MocR family regulator [Roseospira visakhapatnamensis]
MTNAPAAQGTLSAPWRPPALSGEGPVYQAIADALATDIAAGRLTPGVRLPTHRDLAEALGVTVTTITRAYAEARRRGLVTGTVGRGTFVTDPATRRDAAALVGAGHGADMPWPGFTAVRPDTPWCATPDAEERTVDLGPNLPVPVGAEALLAQTLTELAADPRDLASLLAYQPDLGMPHHREAGARWAARSGLPADPGSVVVTAGVQHALTVSLMTLTRPGETVLCGSLTFPGLKLMAERLGLTLEPVALDDDGLVPDSLDAAARRTGARALFCVPTLQNPLGLTFSQARREALAEVARRRDLWVIEDDIYGLLAPQRPPPIAALIPERTLFLAGTSKVLAPGLRTGFAVVPTPLRARFAVSVRASLWMAPPLMVEIAARWMAGGQADRLIQAQRTAVAARRQVAETALRGLPWISGPGAFHIWLPLPPPWRAETYRDAVAARGVVVLAASTFHVGSGAPPEAVRLCLGAEVSPDRLGRALSVAREVLETGPRASAAGP